MEKKIEELLSRTVANIIPDKKSLTTLLLSGKKLNIYLGIDPTSTKIHLGHAVSLRLLQTFSELGHNVSFLIGDFTALVGDTSDKETERPILTSQEIEQNFKYYKSQAEKIVDFSKVNVVHNSDWLSPLTFAQMIHLIQQFSLNDFISRELIRKRLQEGKHIRLDEVIYPIMQGYDSYFMDTDIQIGGTDQTFNMQAGRILQKNFREKESYVITTEFLMGTDGRKMSKTWGNAVWLDDSADDIYAKIMAINDDLISSYYTLATNVPNEEILESLTALKKGENPMKIKKELAFEIVKQLYNLDGAESAKTHFENTFQEKRTPTNVPVLSQVKLAIGDTIALPSFFVQIGIADSNAQVRRLIEQKGIKINNTVIATDEYIVSKLPITIQIGKHKFYQAG